MFCELHLKKKVLSLKRSLIYILFHASMILKYLLTSDLKFSPLLSTYCSKKIILTEVHFYTLHFYMFLVIYYFLKWFSWFTYFLLGYRHAVILSPHVQTSLQTLYCLLHCWIHKSSPGPRSQQVLDKLFLSTWKCFQEKQYSSSLLILVHIKLPSLCVPELNDKSVVAGHGNYISIVSKAKSVGRNGE